MPSILETIAVLHLGLLLSLTGGVKLSQRGPFAYLLSVHQVVPQPLARPLATTVPLVEMGFGLWLLSGRAPAIGAIGAAVVLSSFIIYRVFLYQVRKSPLPCGCAGLAEIQRSSKPAAGTLAAAMNTTIAVAVAVAVGNRQSLYPLQFGVGIATATTVFVVVGVLRRRRYDPPTHGSRATYTDALTSQADVAA